MGWLEWRERLRTQGGTASVLTVRLVLGSCEDYCCPPAFSGARGTTDGGSADTECRSYRVEAFALFTHRAGEFGAFGGHDRWAGRRVDLGVERLRGRRVGAFDDHAAFHLGEGCHDVE